MIVLMCVRQLKMDKRIQQVQTYLDDKRSAEQRENDLKIASINRRQAEYERNQEIIRQKERQREEQFVLLYEEHLKEQRERSKHRTLEISKRAASLKKRQDDSDPILDRIKVPDLPEERKKVQSPIIYDPFYNN